MPTSPEAASVVERLARVAQKTDPKIVGGSIRKDDARALLAVVEAAKPFADNEPCLDEDCGYKTCRLNKALAALYTPDSAEERE